MEGDTYKDIIQPWKIPPDEYGYYAKSYHRGYTGPVECRSKVLDDSTTVWKRADIIKFPNCYRYPSPKNWKEWFLTHHDYKKERCRMRIKKATIPKYASSQYAMVMARYRVTKDKGAWTFNDYGTHIMMISGNGVGRLRRYYSNNPFYFISSFPYDDTLPKKVVDIFKRYEMTNFIKNLPIDCHFIAESRTMFIEEFQKRINEEHI